MTTQSARIVRFALGLGLLVGSIALADDSKEPVISVRLPQAAYNVKLTGKDIVAPQFQLSYSPRELRGRAFGAATQISLKEDAATGNIGGSGVNLKIKTEGKAVKAEGGWAGRPVELTFSPTELTVYVNDCTYRLKNNSEGLYVGRRSCDGAFARDTEVSIPDVFQELSPAEQATLLLFSLT